MNKKIFTLPLTITVMALTSCNKNSFVRHTFNKKLTDNEFNVASTVINAAQKDADGLLTTKSEKGNIKIIKKLNAKSKVDGITVKHNYNDSTYSINYDKSKNTMYQVSKINSLDSQSDTEYLLKNPTIEDDTLFFDLYGKNNIINAKIKRTKSYVFYNPKYSVVDCTNEILKDRSELNLYPSCSIIKDMRYAPYLRSDKVDEDCVGFYDFATNLIKFDSTLANNLVLAKNEGDDKSLSLSFKGSTSFVKYINSCAGEEIEGLKNSQGNIEFDLFWAIEDNFITQIEGKFTANNCKVTFEIEGKTYNVELEHESYYRMEVDYKNSSIPTINENEYAPVS